MKQATISNDQHTMTSFMINQHNQRFGGNIYLNGMPQSGLFQKTCLGNIITSIKFLNGNLVESHIISIPEQHTWMIIQRLYISLLHIMCVY